MNPVDERWGCWYCDQDFETITDAFRHMDEEHPKEAAADLAHMNSEIVRKRSQQKGQA